MLGMWFHAIQLSTTFIPSKKFAYLLQCSALDTQTPSDNPHSLWDQKSTLSSIEE